VVKAAIEEGPPIQVAWREVEDRGVWRFVTEESDRLGKAARPDDLHVARDQVRHEPTRQIGTVNKKQPCHRSARRAMQSAYHLTLDLGLAYDDMYVSGVFRLAEQPADCVTNWWRAKGPAYKG
jgi:hypothetical protein